MKPLTTSVYTFSKLIEGGFLYVDKTPWLYKLLEPASAQYFLARPRRFGKSLLISTLKEICEGHRKLFDGLAIADTDYDWKPYPVIDLDLGSCASNSEDELEENLLRLVHEVAARHQCSISAKRAYQALNDLIRELEKSKGKVVILVDEYDKPLLGHLGKESVTGIQAVLKSFYSVIKTTEGKQRFVLLTGVSKFSRVSVFSDLNNLTDITMNAQYATMLGYTQEELQENFAEYMELLRKNLGISEDALLKKMRHWYNGYRFEEDACTVYNPVSAMKCFLENKFKNFWFETGTPSFLVNLLKDKRIDLSRLEQDLVSENSLARPSLQRNPYSRSRFAHLRFGFLLRRWHREV